MKRSKSCAGSSRNITWSRRHARRRRRRESRRRADKEADVDAEAWKKLIEQYRRGYEVVAEALLKITPEELAARPAPNKWSTREIVHHLADSEMIAASRLRYLLGQDRPTLHGYDQDEFARRLYYDRPHAVSMELFRLVRESTLEILNR